STSPAKTPSPSAPTGTASSSRRAICATPRAYPFSPTPCSPPACARARSRSFSPATRCASLPMRLPSDARATAESARPEHAATLVVPVLFSLLVYAPRVCRALSLADDPAELTTAAALWGVPHAPGYPLYTLLAHFFSLLPVEPAFAVPLLSA